MTRLTKIATISGTSSDIEIINERDRIIEILKDVKLGYLKIDAKQLVILNNCIYGFLIDNTSPKRDGHKITKVDVDKTRNITIIHSEYTHTYDYGLFNVTNYTTIIQGDYVITITATYGNEWLDELKSQPLEKLYSEYNHIIYKL